MVGYCVRVVNSVTVADCLMNFYNRDSNELSMLSVRVLLL